MVISRFILCGGPDADCSSFSQSSQDGGPGLKPSMDCAGVVLIFVCPSSVVWPRYDVAPGVFSIAQHLMIEDVLKS